MGSSSLKVTEALHHTHQLFVETAPFVYFVERSPVYVDRMRAVFSYVDVGSIEVVTSVITLTEALTKPLKLGNKKLEKEYVDLLLTTQNIQLVSITPAIAGRAGDLRARYNLKTPDALQVAAAIETNCQAFLTNDAGIRRVKEIAVLMVDDLELDVPPNPPEA